MFKATEMQRCVSRLMMPAVALLAALRHTVGAVTIGRTSNRYKLRR